MRKKHQMGWSSGRSAVLATRENRESSGDWTGIPGHRSVPAISADCELSPRLLAILNNRASESTTEIRVSEITDQNATSLKETACHKI